MNDLDLIKKFHFDQMTSKEFDAFDQRLQQDVDFAKLYADFLIDESLMKDALSELSITGSEPENHKSHNSRQFSVIVGSLLATAALFLIFFSAPKQQNLDFTPKVISSKSISHFKVGKELELGKFYKIPEGAILQVQYPDESILEFSHESEFSFNRKGDSKLVYLNTGKLYGDIQKQEFASLLIETSSSKAEILGTRFNLLAANTESTLEVFHGKIRFQNRSGSEDIVLTGEKATARSDQAVIAEAIQVMEIDESLERYNNWLTFSNTLRNDPDLIAYYDHFKGEYPYVLKNMAKHNLPHLRDGRITEPHWTKGRWPQKGALYYSSYSYVDCGKDDHFNFNDQITIFAWVKVKKFSKNFQAIVTRGDKSWRIARNGNANSIEFACGPNNPLLVRGTTTIDDNQWHLITACYDGRYMKLYIDGEIDVLKKVEGKINLKPNTRVDIGTNNEKSFRGFEGWMDEVAIFKRALTEEEIKKIYEIGKPSEDQ